MGKQPLDLNSDQKKVQVWLFLSLLGSSLEPVLVKLFKPEISPISLIVLKSLSASVLMLPFYGKLRKLSKVDIVPVIQVSILAFITNALIFLSLQTIPATTLISIITTTPLLVALLNHKMGKGKVTAQFLVAFLVVFTGVILTLEVLVKDTSFTLNFGFGLAFISVITSALYRLNMDTLTKKIDPISISASIFAFNGILSFFLLPIVQIPEKVIPFGIWLGFAGMIANVFFLYAIKHLGSTRVSILSVIQRPIAVIFGAVLLKELVSMVQIVGMVLIFSGIYFAKLAPAPVKVQR